MRSLREHFYQLVFEGAQGLEEQEGEDISGY